MLSNLRDYIFLILIFATITASAQFFVTGDDPGRVKWSFIESENFRLIYPEGSDSLALVYGQNLERFRIPVSRSLGYIPCGPDNPFNRRMDIILHTHYGNNGSVAWAPKRMDLYAIPGAYAPDPSPWNAHLAVHELRHVAQMQFGFTNFFKPGNYILGQIWEGLAVIIYPGAPFLEGDAVIAETAFTKSGRGRISDFLNYYRVAFDNGDYRKWGHWRFSSQRNYSPNHYALGYLCLGGARHIYDSPTIYGDALHMASRKPLRFGAKFRQIEEVSGKKFQGAFMEICDSIGKIWKAEADARAPYIISEQVVAEPRLYTDYTSVTFAGTEMYAVKSGHLDTPVLIGISQDGQEKKIAQMGYQISDLKADSEGRLWWSENRTDRRWTLQTGAVVRKLDGKKIRTVGKNALRYNPAPQGSRLSVSEYTLDGRTGVNVLDNSGKVLQCIKAPDSLQIVQTVWLSENDIYANCVSDNGYGIYHIDLSKGTWTNSLAPQPVMIKNLRTHGGEITFTSDRTGVNELYHFNPATGKVSQKTSIRHGGDNFCYSPDGNYLYYTSPTMKGNLVFRTSTDGLMVKEVNFTEYHKYAIAEAVARQEKELAAAADQELFPEDSISTFSEAKRYRKFPNAFKVHSWLPAYVSVDNIMNMSFDRFYQALSLGASALIQNDLSTAVGEFGYSAHKDPYNPKKWRHSGHVKYTYTGLYPVFEVKADFNDRALRQYSITSYKNEGEGGYISMSSRELSAPYFQGSISTYIPCKFTNGGWYSGFIPKLTYTFTNDRFNTSFVKMSYENGGIFGEPTFIGSTDGKNILRQYLSGSVRGYVMLSTPNSAVYSRWGVGLEIGANGSLGLRKYLSPMGYVYAYGYVPGFTREQGTKLTVLHQSKLSSDSYFGQAIVNVLPRGLKNHSDLLSRLSVNNPHMTKLSLDYAVPVFIGDIVVGRNILAIKRLVLTPSFDCTLVGKQAKLWSANLDLAFDFESILTLEFPMSLGVTGSYNGGFNGSFEELNVEKRFFFGPIFNVSF
jgi:hypothetical protein